MSRKTPSVDLNFEVVFDKEKETDLQKIKRWIRKQNPPFNIILEYLFSFIEERYFCVKIENTMRDVDRQAEAIVEQWEKEDEQPKPEIVETGVFGEEGWSISISNPVVERRSQETDGRMGTGSNEKGLGGPLPDPWD